MAEEGRSKVYSWLRNDNDLAGSTLRSDHGIRIPFPEISRAEARARRCDGQRVQTAAGGRGRTEDKSMIQSIVFHG